MIWIDFYKQQPPFGERVLISVEADLDPNHKPEDSHDRYHYYTAIAVWCCSCRWIREAKDHMPPYAEKITHWAEIPKPLKIR